ncbi:MAG TPA: helicase C-terminal domain-containing protein [Nitrospiraceae bacterium]
MNANDRIFEEELDRQFSLTPSELGIRGFKQFRTAQWEAMEYVRDGGKRFSALCLPTGAGKSLSVIGVGKLQGWKVVALTSTKGLQTQYMNDFEKSGMVDVRGKANYKCKQFKFLTCDEGGRQGCACMGSAQCPYSLAVNKARANRLVVSNYAYWLHANASGRGLELPNVESTRVDCLVLDEAHTAAEELSRFLQISISRAEIEDMLGKDSMPSGDEVADWQRFGQDHAREMKVHAEELGKTLAVQGSLVDPEMVQYHKQLEILAEKLEKLAGISSNEWVVEKHTDRKNREYWTADPIWPGRYAERSLFVGVPHIILLSATLNRKTLSLLGIKAEDCQFREWPRIFPANRNPIYHVPTVKMNFRTTDLEMIQWVKRIDEIIDGRMDRKGLIHTVAYHRQQFLMNHSRHRGIMMGNTSDPDSPNAAEVVRAFKASKSPRVLVSPSFSTGWDFPGTDAEYQIISKIAFPDSQSKVMKARKARDGGYINYLAMQDLVQAAGRPSRSMDDRSETVIVDDNIGWFLFRNRELAPKWFTVRRMASVPKAPPKL